MQKENSFGPEIAVEILGRYSSRVHLHAGEEPSLLYRFKGINQSPEKKLKEAILFMEEINSFKDSLIRL
jgi:hypothetical protein